MTSYPRIFPLKLTQLRFHFHACDTIKLPVYPGSAWRGVIGHALRRTVCVTRAPRCDGCFLLQSCAYANLFEPKLTTAIRQSHDLPRPFVLSPERRQPSENGKSVIISPGDLFYLDVTLFGESQTSIPYLVHALEKNTLGGLGNKHNRSARKSKATRGRYKLTAVSQKNATSGTMENIYQPGHKISALLPDYLPVPEAPTGTITLKWLTPFRYRMRAEGMIGPENFHFYHLISPLLRRIENFVPYSERYWNAPQLLQRAKEISVSKQKLWWQRQIRFSSRQRQTVNISGLMGTVTYQADQLEEFWPLLWAGQFLHVGKGSSLGLGKYALEAQKSVTAC